MLNDQLSPEPPSRLVRSLGVMGVLFLTLSVATPASSVFVIIPGMLQVAGTGAIWAMLLAGMVCVATAFVYAELSSAYPVAGGEYVMVAHTLGPLSGFVMLGVNVFNNLLFPPVAGLGVSAVLGTLIPGLPQIPVAIAIVGASMLIALLQIRVNAWVTGIFLLVEVLALAAIVWLGFADAARPFGDFLLHPVMPDLGALVPASPASIGLATSIAIFALNGYGAAVYFGEEMHEPSKLIARAIMWALGFTLLFEALPLAAGLMGAPDLHAFVTADDPFGILVTLRGGAALSAWVSIGVVIAIVNAVIACILACARFFYGTARDGSWGRPIDRWMTVIHPRFGSPWVGTLLVGGIGMACCFLPLQLLLVLSGTGLVAIYAGICLAAISGRRSGKTAHAHYRMPWYPIAPIVTLIALTYVIWTSWLDREEGRPGLIMTGVQILGSAAYYWFVLRRRGAWDVQIPAD
ncbi:amino acid transporter [Sphingomonas sp. UYAg733]